MTDMKTLRAVTAESELEDALECISSDYSAPEFLLDLDNYVKGNVPFYGLKDLILIGWINTEVQKAQRAKEDMTISEALLQEVTLERVFEEYQVSESAEPIVQSVKDYFLSTINKYDSSVFRSMFSGILKAASFLPEGYRAKPLDHLVGLMEVDEKSKQAAGNPYFVPRVIGVLMVPLLEEYKGKLGLLGDNNTEKHDETLKGFSSDLDKLVLYTRGKLALNEKWGDDADKISYTECFPYKVKRDYSKLNSAYIHALERGENPDSNGKGLVDAEVLAEKYFSDKPLKVAAASLSRLDIAAYSLAYHFGPVTTANHNSRGEDGQNIKLGFGLHIVSLDYPKGLSDEQKGFLQTAILVSDKLDPGSSGRNRIRPLLWGQPT